MGYANTSKDRIKDTLAKAQFLLDDPIGGGNNSNINETSNFGGYNNDFRGILSQPQLNKGYSAPGAPSYTKSQYTGSEIGGDSEYETHSQMQ